MKTFDYGRYAEAVWKSGIVSLVAAIHERKGRQEAFLADEPPPYDFTLATFGICRWKIRELERKIEETKETYYEALKLASVGWMEDKADVTPFIDCLLGIVLSAYRDFESRVAAVAEKLPAIEQVRQAVKRTIGRFTRSDIMELCPLIEKSSVASSLKKLVESGEISVHGRGRGTFYSKNN